MWRRPTVVQYWHFNTWMWEVSWQFSGYTKIQFGQPQEKKQKCSTDFHYLSYNYHRRAMTPSNIITSWDSTSRSLTVGSCRAHRVDGEDGERAASVQMSGARVHSTRTHTPCFTKWHNRNNRYAHIMRPSGLFIVARTCRIPSEWTQASLEQHEWESFPVLSRSN